MEKGKAFIFTAPSGAGKTTIVRHLLKSIDQLAFSVSATTRPQRDYETDGIHYYFLTQEDFLAKLDNNEFIEHEEVYAGSLYGTLKSEVERLWAAGKHLIFDVDVEGAVDLQKYFGANACSVFVKPPSFAVLKERLEKRGSEDEASLAKRLAKVEKELNYSHKFDHVLVNDDLQIAFDEAETIVRKFLTTHDTESK